ncbi:MAG: hypothetical protein LUP94_00210 [Candidatus Methanomethylicus sp.]|nr:hypothetical protein [Candidatus Methanomethylicus sp.]
MTMIFELPRGEGDFRHMMVAGLLPKAKCSARYFLNEAGKIASVSAQVIDARFVAGLDHLITAGMLAARTWNTSDNISRSPATEILLYASGERQIKEAISQLGVTESSFGWVVFAVSSSESRLLELQKMLADFGSEDDGLIDLSDLKEKGLMEKFAISPEDLELVLKLTPSRIESLRSLVLEKVSLSELSR